MKHSQASVEEQIASFMARKEKLFPEILSQRVVRTRVEQRGRRATREFSSVRLQVKNMRTA